MTVDDGWTPAKEPARQHLLLRLEEAGQQLDVALRLLRDHEDQQAYFSRGPELDELQNLAKAVRDKADSIDRMI